MAQNFRLAYIKKGRLRCERCGARALFILVTPYDVNPIDSGLTSRLLRRPGEAFEAVCGECFDRERDGAKLIYYAQELETEPATFLETVRVSGGARRMKDLIAWLGPEGLAAIEERGR